MNYYKHHIGDYAAATAHLSWDEDMAYRRLLSAYYQHEKPIPADMRAVYRLVRASSKAQREAVETVLNEFFVLEDDGWHQKRCDEELDRARAQAEANKKVAMEREQRKRGAKPASTNRSTNRADNEHESFDTEKHDSFESREPSHKPLANSHKTAEAVTSHADSHSQPPAPRPPTDAGRACLLMRQAGCPTTNPSHPHLLAALSEGVTPEALGHTAVEAKALGKSNPFTWALATARSRHAEGASPISGGTHATPEPRESLVDRNARRAAEILGGVDPA
jgi:uncharacterized protein YdaU (DUF1376 family)